MIRRVLIAAIVFSLGLPAAAQMRTIAEAHELTLSDIRLPQSEAGTIAFRRCESCPMRTKRVSADMLWIFNGRSLSLEDFRLEVARLPDHSAVDATLLHHLENDRVMKVTVLFP